MFRAFSSDSGAVAFTGEFIISLVSFEYYFLKIPLITTMSPTMIGNNSTGAKRS